MAYDLVQIAGCRIFSLLILPVEMIALYEVFSHEFDESNFTSTDCRKHRLEHLIYAQGFDGLNSLLTVTFVQMEVMSIPMVCLFITVFIEVDLLILLCMSKQVFDIVCGCRW